MKAEGMGFEPTTPCGASDFESAQKHEIPEKNGGSGQVVSILGSSQNNQVVPDPDLEYISEHWSKLPDTLRAGIVAMVKVNVQ